MVKSTGFRVEEYRGKNFLSSFDVFSDSRGTSRPNRSQASAVATAKPPGLEIIPTLFPLGFLQREKATVKSMSSLLENAGTMCACRKTAP